MFLICRHFIDFYRVVATFQALVKEGQSIICFYWAIIGYRRLSYGLWGYILNVLYQFLLLIMVTSRHIYFCTTILDRILLLSIRLLPSCCCLLSASIRTLWDSRRHRLCGRPSFVCMDVGWYGCNEIGEESEVGELIYEAWNLCAVDDLFKINEDSASNVNVDWNLW